MLQAVLAAALLGQPTQAGGPVPLRWGGVRETLASYLVRPGMTQDEVHELMGLPFGSDTLGPPGEAHTTDSYLWSGIHVTFGPDGLVRGVSGGYWRPTFHGGSK